MSLEEKLAAIKAETAAANALAATYEQKITEERARFSKVESEIMKVLSDPNFPEKERRLFLERLGRLQGK